MDKEKFLEQLREYLSMFQDFQETAKKIKEKSEKYINPFIGRVLSNMNNYIIIDYFEVNIDDRFEGLDISDLINHIQKKVFDECGVDLVAEIVILC
jgi:nucleoid-associated protein YejK